jgi:mannose-6-phosphate isomerase-like protein (cupin superfamily)
MDVLAKLFTRDSGKALTIGRMTIFPRMTADETLGAYTVMEAIVPPDSGSALHRHWSFDEAAFVIEGTFECHLDGMRTRVGANESVYWPRGAIHKFRSIGPASGRILFICSPGRIFEDFMKQISSSQIQTGTATSGPALDFRAIASKHGIEFIDE